MWEVNQFPKAYEMHMMVFFLSVGRNFLWWMAMLSILIIELYEAYVNIFTNKVRYISLIFSCHYRCDVWRKAVKAPQILQLRTSDLNERFRVCSYHFSSSNYLTSTKLLHNAYPDQNLPGTKCCMLMVHLCLGTVLYITTMWICLNYNVFSIYLMYM